MGAPHWLALFGVILGAWLALYAMALPADLRASARIFGAAFWESLCTVTPDAAGFGRVVLMWALMAAAMMAPTALPAFATYDDLGRSTQTRFGALVAGYLIVWLGFSVLAGGLQMGLFTAGLVSAFGDSLSVWLSAGLLLVAGLYQFSPVKEACLSKCRAPLTFFMAHWDEGALRNGVRLGLVCLGCCWALMLLAFVGGVMNIAFMGLATLIMVIEKLPQYGRVLTRPLGAVLIVSAVFVALGAV
ncbi:MAG: DUF2182 domain-containing protein [Rhodobacterales bacterium]|nr:DUF2182 domain-containing protein [Rhodobacterales bacterium]MDX5390422.1 DUF2182 domain-containing protein [Rhodobacterales bacterium]MDX5490117.1 DUF2182 domain-containing protein [Rhodobacterales bacterium]